MIYPSIDLLMEKVDSKYSLVVMSARRARDLLDGEKSPLETNSQKYVGVALEEIAADVLAAEDAKPKE